MEPGILIACLALLATTLIFIFYIEPDASDSAPHRSQLDGLLERRDTIYENLRDLKFEHRSGKFSVGDYEEMRAALEKETALVLAEIENVTGGVARAQRREAPSAGAQTSQGKST